MTTPFFAEELDSGSRCSEGHPLMMVAEGYAICHGEGRAICDGSVRRVWWAWRLTPPRVGELWRISTIRGRDELPITAWFHLMDQAFKAEALAVIQADMDAHRALPFDEDAERARLMPV